MPIHPFSQHVHLSSPVLRQKDRRRKNPESKEDASTALAHRYETLDLRSTLLKSRVCSVVGDGQRARRDPNKVRGRHQEVLGVRQVQRVEGAFVVAYAVVRS